MHELGVLRLAVKTVNDIAEKNKIKRIKHITLEVGRDSDFVPDYFEKLYPAAIDSLPRMKKSVLKIEMVEGKGLNIKNFGY